MNKFKVFSSRKLVLEGKLAELNRRRRLADLQSRQQATTILEPSTRRLDHVRGVGLDEALAEFSRGQLTQMETV